MKAGIYYTASGPIAVLTARESLTDPSVVERLHAKGVDAFLAWEIPLDEARARYGSHFGKVVGDQRETDDLRVLDENGQRVFQFFPPSRLGRPVSYP
jgi:hypothetical protein